MRAFVPFTASTNWAFSGKDRARGAVHAKKFAAGGNAFAVFREPRDFDVRRKFAEGCLGEGEPSGHERFAGFHRRARGRIGRDGGESCDVARADVLGESGTDGLADFVIGQRTHAVIMAD